MTRRISFYCVSLSIVPNLQGPSHLVTIYSALQLNSSSPSGDLACLKKLSNILNDINK